MASPYGRSFSPIDPESTLEELPELLRRLYGGGGIGIGKLPRPSIRGALPLGGEVFEAFLGTPEEAAPAGGGISDILAPEEPVPVEAPVPEPVVPGVEPTPEPVAPGVEPSPAPDYSEPAGPAPGYGNEPPVGDEYTPPADYSEPSDLLPGGIESEPMFQGPADINYPTGDGGDYSDPNYGFGGEPEPAPAPGPAPDYSDYSDPNYGFGGPNVNYPDLTPDEYEGVGGLEQPGAPPEAESDFQSNPPEGFSPYGMADGENRIDMGGGGYGASDMLDQGYGGGDYSDPNYGFGGSDMWDTGGGGFGGITGGAEGGAGGAEGGGFSDLDWDRMIQEMFGPGFDMR